MDKIRKPHQPDEGKCIFTEGIDYFKTDRDSIWGPGDDDTLEVLENVEMRGKWLNLAAGDGRYNDILLKKADSVVASDIDASALSKLWHNTSPDLRERLNIEIFDITEKFSLEDQSFDGILCTGTLHLFPREVLKEICGEIDRILKRGGRLIIDFATDIKRVSPKGEPVKFGREPNYGIEDAKQYLNKLFKQYNVKFRESKVRESFESSNPPYELNCNFLIMIGSKG
ncbi:MAG: class I SAM-dependent methyltransferase [Candidatus Aenigmatarchaeota archaeon]